ncbi:MAG: hypothetical protein Q9223_007042 [Gallowayella weberi]
MTALQQRYLPREHGHQPSDYHHPQAGLLVIVQVYGNPAMLFRVPLYQSNPEFFQLVESQIGGLIPLYGFANRFTKYTIGKAKIVEYHLPDMDEYTADAFVNRDEPVPVLAFSGTGSPPPDPENKRSRLRESISNSKLKEKLQDGANSRSDTGFSLQDRLLTK